MNISNTIVIVCILSFTARFGLVTIYADVDTNIMRKYPQMYQSHSIKGSEGIVGNDSKHDVYGNIIITGVVLSWDI